MSQKGKFKTVISRSRYSYLCKMLLVLSLNRRLNSLQIYPSCATIYKYARSEIIFHLTAHEKGNPSLNSQSHKCFRWKQEDFRLELRKETKWSTEEICIWCEEETYIYIIYNMYIHFLALYPLSPSGNWPIRETIPECFQCNALSGKGKRPASEPHFKNSPTHTLWEKKHLPLIVTRVTFDLHD